MTTVSLRGTHGSGKSTVVKKILDAYGGEPVPCPQRGLKKPLGYAVQLPTGAHLFVIGSYTTACGGCDSIQPYEQIWERHEDALQSGFQHVLMEGVLVSNSYGNIGRASEVYGDQFVFATLDTPLEACLQRIAARRAAKGSNTAPVNPAHPTRIYENVHKLHARFGPEFGRRAVLIDHTKPTQQVMKLFGVTIRKEL